MTRQLQPGDRVRVSGPPGAVEATIEACTDIDALPQVPGFDTPAALIQLRSILAESDVTAVAVISYEYKGNAILFAATVNTAGEWRDAKGQQINITHLDPAQASIFGSGTEYPR